MKSLTEISSFKKWSNPSEKKEENLDQVVIRFAGDSGDGMQLTGNQFTTTTAFLGNDLSTLPDFPAEIRAPQGTIAGVSGFQIHFSSQSIMTPGDELDVLVAMNPAALKANLHDLKKNGIVLLNENTFEEANLIKAGFEQDPRSNGSLEKYQTIALPMTKLTIEALSDLKLRDKEKERSKNMFALGVAYWLFSRSLDPTIRWLEKKFKDKEDIAKANILALKAGRNYAETTELLPIYFKINKAPLKPGTYRNITGNEAISMGIIAVSELSKTSVFLGSYPITPASDVLHYLSNKKNFGIKTFQAEDEIAAVSSAIGASFAGYLGCCTTSGPGFSLKSEAMNLCVMLELPLVIINLQRGGPSTGLPTKTEQGDLLQTLFGRNGESPLCVIAARSSSDCFFKAIEAFKIAVKYMVPVVLLSDAFLANSSEPWKLPSEKELPTFNIKFNENLSSENQFMPYARDKNTLARSWVKLGTPGLEHRIGGLEKEENTGNVSYEAKNHEKMVRLRASKVQRIIQDIAPLQVRSHKKTDTLLLGWGSTYGSIKDAIDLLAKENIFVDQVHIDHISPFPKDLEEILRGYKHIFVAELNMGQLAFLIQGAYSIRVHKINKVQGNPFHIKDITEAIKKNKT